MPEPAKPGDAIPDPIEAAIRNSIATVDEGLTDDVVDENAVVEEPATAAAAEGDAAPPVAAVVEPPVEDAAAVAAAAAAAAAAPPAAAAVAPGDELDITKIPVRGANGRINTIPQPRVVKMVEKSVAKAKETWAKTELAPVKQKVDIYETRLKSIGDTERLMFGSNEKGVPLQGEAGLALKRTFLQQLVNAVPGYAELLRGANLGGTVTANPPATTTTTATASADDPEPKPDVLDANQKPIGWSEEGLSRLRAWDRRQAGREAVAAAEATLVKKYGLDRMSGRFKEVEGQAEQRQSIEQEIDTAAQRWPGFRQNAGAILKALTENADPAFGLRDAYNTVLYGLASTRTTDEAALEATLRDRIAAELRTAPRSTSTSAASISTRAAEDVESSGDPVEDAIRRSIRGLK